MNFQSTKVYDGFSTCFRQWRAEGTHCKYLHGYGVSFKVWFEGNLDKKNWVFDFGGAKRAVHTIDGRSPNDWFKWLLDHTVIVAQDDPMLEQFIIMAEKGVIQLRTLPHVGAEQFAKYLYGKINEFVAKETNHRVMATKVEFREHNKNAAAYWE